MSDAAPDNPPKTNGNKIFAVRNDRLGGRLGAMLNAMRIANDYGLEFRFAWSDHEDVSPELQQPEALFAPEFLQRHRETARSFGDLQQNLILIETLHPASREAFAGTLAKGADLRCVESMRVVRLPWEAPEYAAARLAETLDSIAFVPRVKEAMAAIRDRLGGADLVAYHLRRGDIISPEARPSNVLWPDKYLPRVYYEAHMRRVLAEAPDTRIVVFSDAPHELAAFAQMSDRIIPAPELLAQDDLHILQRDFLELYTMSRCRRIIGPGASAFSSVAALLGNGRIISIKADLTPPEHEAAMVELTRRLDHHPEMFAGNADLGQNFPELLSFHRQKGTRTEARRILRKHLDRGFSQSYIYDLLAEEYFFAGDADGALHLIDTLRDRPILADLGNAGAYVWAGLAALGAGRTDDAVRLAHIGQWLQPNLPIARLLVSVLAGQRLFPRNDHYPLPADLIVPRATMLPRILDITRRLNAILTGQTEQPEEVPALPYIPFELDIREWFDLHSTRLPTPFWNLANQMKMIGFFRSTYRGRLDDPAVMSVLGQLLYQAKETAEGAPLIEAAYRQQPEDAFIQQRMARLRLREGRHMVAMAHYDAAVDLSGGQICFRAEHAAVQMRMGDKKPAIETFAELALIPHHMPELMILTADVLRRKRDTRDLALSVAAQAHALVPGGTRTSQIYRKILEDSGRETEAEAIRAQMVEWRRGPGKFSSRLTRIE